MPFHRVIVIVPMGLLHQTLEGLSQHRENYELGWFFFIQENTENLPKSLKYVLHREWYYKLFAFVAKF